MTRGDEMEMPHPSEETLMAWMDGEVSGVEAASIRAHVSACPPCRRVVDQQAALTERLARWGVEPAAFPAPVVSRPSGHIWRWAAAACLALAAITLPAWWWSNRSGSDDGTARFSANIFLPGALQAAELTSRTAPKVTLTVFVDWQCPACALSYDTYFDLMKEYEASAPGQVALVIKDFPINAACNAAVTTAHHPAACEAAAAVRMARARGRAEAMIRFLIGHVTPALQPDAVRAAAIDVLGPLDFDAEYARELPEIRADVADAVARQVKFTPSFYVNGEPLKSNGQGLPTAADLRAAIDDELR